MTVKIHTRNIAFYIFWGILMVGKGLGYSAADPIFQNMCWAAILFAALKLLGTRYSICEICSCILLNMLGILIGLFSGSMTALLTTITITSMKDIDYMLVFKMEFWIRGLMFIVRTTMALTGMIDIQEQYFYEAEGIRIRYGLGYGQPNAAHFTLFLIVVVCVLAYHDRMRPWHYIALLLYNFFIFGYTNSRTGVLMTAVFMILCWMASSKRKLGFLLWKVVQAVSNKAFIVTTVVSFAASALFWKIDALRSLGTFSSRFRTAINVISNNSLNLFGTKGISTDLGMINFLYGDGVIFLLLFLPGYYLLLKKCNKQKDVFFMIACCCYAVYCLSEAYADSALMNVTLLAFGNLLYGKESVKRIAH